MKIEYVDQAAKQHYVSYSSPACWDIHTVLSLLHVVARPKGCQPSVLS